MHSSKLRGRFKECFVDPIAISQPYSIATRVEDSKRHEWIMDETDSQLLEEYEKFRISPEKSTSLDSQDRLRAEQLRREFGRQRQAVMVEAKSRFQGLFDESLVRLTSLHGEYRRKRLNVLELQEREGRFGLDSDERHARLAIKNQQRMEQVIRECRKKLNDTEVQEHQQRALLDSEECTVRLDIKSYQRAEQARKAMNITQRQAVIIEAHTDLQELFDESLVRLATLREQHLKALAVIRDNRKARARAEMQECRRRAVVDSEEDHARLDINTRRLADADRMKQELWRRYCEPLDAAEARDRNLIMDDACQLFEMHRLVYLSELDLLVPSTLKSWRKDDGYRFASVGMELTGLRNPTLVKTSPHHQSQRDLEHRCAQQASVIAELERRLIVAESNISLPTPGARTRAKGNLHTRKKPWKSPGSTNSPLAPSQPSSSSSRFAGLPRKPLLRESRKAGHLAIHEVPPVRLTESLHVQLVRTSPTSTKYFLTALPM